MTIFFYKGLTRNPELGNTPVWVLPNIWRLGQLGDTKFGTNISNKILLNAAKCQGHSFYRFWVIKGKPTGMGVKLPLPPLTQIMVKYTFQNTATTHIKENKSCIDLTTWKHVKYGSTTILVSWVNYNLWKFSWEQIT